MVRARMGWVHLSNDGGRSWSGWECTVPFFDVEVFVLVPMPCLCDQQWNQMISDSTSQKELSHTMIRRRQIILSLRHFLQRSWRVRRLDLKHTLALWRLNPSSRSDASVLL